MAAHKPELLAPAGSPEALNAALLGGADAIYFGGADFNARINASNFSTEAIADAVKKCHEKGVRAYVTLNTLVLEREYKNALEFVGRLWECKVDALIVADLGLISRIRQAFPDFELHASTQMGVHSSDGARTLCDMGFKRVVVARELSKENIQSIVDTGVEVEMFCHGALCVCHSGQCLFSSLVGGRSGNRGLCAQPCRLPYNGSYPLSLKDNCLAGHVREILKSGVASLKIEGRMKSPDYVYAVTSAWRGLIDGEIDATAKEIKEMEKIFSRGGFTDGYYTHRLGADMLGIRSEKDKDATRRISQRMTDLSPKREPIVIRNRIKNGEISTEKRNLDFNPKASQITLSARFYKPDTIPKNHPFDVLYLPLECWDTRANGVMVPPVITDFENEKIYSKLKKLKKDGCTYALCGNIGQIKKLREMGFTVNADFRLGAYSAESAKVLFGLGVSGVIFSPELTVPQLRDIKAPKSAVIYGRIPLMLLEKRVGTTNLRDRKGVVFPVIREGGRDIVLNSAVTYMLDKENTLKLCGISTRHFIFTTETGDEVNRVISAYKNHKSAPTQNIRRIKDK